jgi:hypothetical protein
MLTISFNVHNKGSSTFRPHFFDDNNYAYWKVRMIIYLQSIDYDLWLSIKNGPHKPTKIKNDITVPKARNDYNNSDKKLLSMNVKAMNILYCALSKSEFNKIASYKNAKDIWHVLKIIYERTNKIKE